MYYWDTSALLALVFDEAHSQPVKTWSAKAKALPAVTSFFAFIEMESALSRRLSAGEVSVEQVPEIRLLMQQVEAALAVLWPDAALLTRSRHMISSLGLRPGDALHLASALQVDNETKLAGFVCLDKKLALAARASRLVVEAFA